MLEIELVCKKCWNVKTLLVADSDLDTQQKLKEQNYEFEHDFDCEKYGELERNGYTEVEMICDKCGRIHFEMIEDNKVDAAPTSFEHDWDCLEDEE